jgi:hypothetical protein
MYSRSTDALAAALAGSPIKMFSKEFTLASGFNSIGRNEVTGVILKSTN